MDVYIELVYVINLLIIMIALMMTSILLNTNWLLKKIIKDSLLLNISWIAIFVNPISWLIIIIWLVIFLCIFRKQTFLYYPVYLFVYFSLLFFNNSLINDSLIYNGFLITPISYIDISLFFVATFFIIVFVLYISYINKKVTNESYFYDLVLTVNHCKYYLKGFMDSGNEVFYQGFPLILVNSKLINNYITIDCLTIDNINDLKINISMASSCFINKQELNNIYIGIIDNIKYDCLLNKQLMGGII